MRAALMSALAEVPELDAEFVADRLLPTVRRIVADELGEMADRVDAESHREPVLDRVVAKLHDRADVLAES